MAQAEQATYEVKPDKYDMDPVIEVWESMGGSLWFITEVDENGYGFGYARLSHCPQFAEWGTINRPELQENPQVWQVDRQNWGNINSYEDGLLVRVEE